MDAQQPKDKAQIEAIKTDPSVLNKLIFGPDDTLRFDGLDAEQLNMDILANIPISSSYLDNNGSDDDLNDLEDNDENDDLDEDDAYAEAINDSKDNKANGTSINSVTREILGKQKESAKTKPKGNSSKAKQTSKSKSKMLMHSEAIKHFSGDYTNAAKNHIHTYDLAFFCDTQKKLSLQKKFIQFEEWVTKTSISDPVLIDARMARVHSFVDYLVRNCARLKNYVRFEVAAGLNPDQGEPDFVHIRVRVPNNPNPNNPSNLNNANNEPNSKRNNSKAFLILGHERCRQILATLVPSNMHQCVWPSLGKKKKMEQFPSNNNHLDGVCKALAERSTWTLDATNKNGLEKSISVNLGFPEDEGISWSVAIAPANEHIQILLQIMYNSYYDTAVAALFLLHSLSLNAYIVHQHLLVPNPVLLATPRPKIRTVNWGNIGNMYRHYFKNPFAITHHPHPFRSIPGMFGARAKILSSLLRPDVSYEVSRVGENDWQPLTAANATKMLNSPDYVTRLSNNTKHRGRLNTLVAASNAQKKPEDALLQGIDESLYKKKSTMTKTAKRNRDKWVHGLGGLHSLMKIYEGSPAPENEEVKRTFHELFKRANREVSGVSNKDIDQTINNLADQYNRSEKVREYLSNVSKLRTSHYNSDGSVKKRKYMSFSEDQKTLKDTGFCKEYRDTKSWFERNGDKHSTAETTTTKEVDTGVA